MPDSIIAKYSTEVYILFPEYSDVYRKMSAPYVKGYTFDFEPYSPPGVKEIMDVIDFFDYERIDYYYDSKNLDGLYYPNEILDEYPFIDTMIRSTITQMDIKDWRTIFKEDDSTFIWQGNALRGDTCAFVHSRENLDSESVKVHATMLSSEDAMILEDKKIIMTREYGEEIHVAVQTSIEDMYKWICINRLPQRRFDVDDKHGENGVGARSIPGKGTAGKLLCFRTHAQELLVNAIGKGRESDLWYYDFQHEAVLYFENQYEIVQPAFHGYHVHPGEDNYDQVEIKRLMKLQAGLHL